MGRRNTGPKSNLQLFQWLNSFESADSKKTLPCLGLIEYSPKDRVSFSENAGLAHEHRQQHVRQSVLGSVD